MLSMFRLLMLAPTTLSALLPLLGGFPNAYMQTSVPVLHLSRTMAVTSRFLLPCCSRFTLVGTKGGARDVMPLGSAPFPSHGIGRVSDGGHQMAASAVTSAHACHGASRALHWNDNCGDLGCGRRAVTGGRWGGFPRCGAGSWQAPRRMQVQGPA